MGNDFILLSPYSNRIFTKDQTGKDVEIRNAKNYPFFNELLTLLRISGEHVIQIGRTGERKLEGVDDFFLDISFQDIEKLLRKAKFFISVDNFLPHLANAIGIKKGIVIYGPSDPELFGYKHFCNLLKDRKYLRPDQFHKWHRCVYNQEAFVQPEIVANAVFQINGTL